ncbi:MAG: hypothetical protein U0324_01650 [Polyangiales bacterium]
MDEPAPDPRTAARVASIRAACALPVARVHGSLEGRADGEVLAATIEPDGRHAALVLRDAIERWDLDALACVGRWEVAPPGYVNNAVCVARAPGGVRVDGPAGLWRATDAGDGWRALPTIDRLGTFTQAVGDVLAVWRQGILHVFHFEDGASCWSAPLQAAPAEVALSRDGRFLLRSVSAASFDVLEPIAPGAGGPAELRTVARIATGAPTVGGVRAVAVNGARRLAAIATTEGVVLGRWDDWWGAVTLAARPRRPLQMGFSGDGGRLVLRDGDCVVRVDVATGEVRLSRGEPGPNGKTSYAWPATSSGRVLGVSRGGLHVLDDTAEDFRTRAFDPVGQVACAAGTPDGRALITGADDGAVRVRDRATGEVLAQAEAGAAVVAVAASPDGREVVALRADGELSWYDRATGALAGRVDNVLDAKRGDASGLALSPDGRVAAVVGRPLAPVVVRVDLATGARGALDPPPGGAKAPSEGDASFTAEGAIRCLRAQDFGEEGTRIVVVEHAPDGAARALLPRPQIDLGEETAIDSLWYVLSRDGRLLWRCASGAAMGTAVSVVATDAPDDPPVQWAIDGWPLTQCAGDRLLAFATFDGSLVLLAAHGASVSTPWPRGCVPLAFAPDDGALWVRDASGLVAEVTVPSSLRAPAAP